MFNWDYNLPKNWKPNTDEEWIWYIERIVNYGATKGEKLDKNIVKKYFPQLRLEKERKEYLKFLLYEK
ncbi:hypothetical protein A2767_07160 [Candidatus Roizmanbacteria bacterium RIFCSPHIGHO2_01_FULL_35_10]|uniref:Uncharacterized protein n=1 Tax=Candidatus Roizmanbacteria bacterium RIFCSPLOWO2_01_FULL_35_13 TaxID=1802055 RepID=A0A1F7ID90_9BACT|nr:MAG: hypothetical protein A2767_07160 [Candidatus Roizmanbacteria bacterium RIFCSPHIGHO2_01_FULL_35_10]OGK41334.1 MAG: hypothetical protein A3A74_03300 [Candidatus Roizmanbacteria bacterium RIFCSPLOWO2_01_FULL_35_13]